MTTNLPMHVLWTLSVYADGVEAGRDIGLLFALHTITGEIARQDQLAATRRSPHSLTTGRSGRTR